MRRYLTRRWKGMVLLGGAALFGGFGALIGPVWMVAGVIAGAPVALVGYAIVLAFVVPDAGDMLRSGKPYEALAEVETHLDTWRHLADRWPGQFRSALASQLAIKAAVLQELDQLPQALDAADEAVGILRDIEERRPGAYRSLYAEVLARQAALLSAMSRHGEALAAIQTAVWLYRGLAVHDRSRYIRDLADALTRMADALGYLDRVTEARAAQAEAHLIHTDMLPGAAPP